MPVRNSAAPASQALAAAICHARELAGMTLVEVARELRVSRSTVWAWEAARSTPCLYDLVGLACLYGWRTAWLGEVLYSCYPAGCRRLEGR
jgi:transcriptional regulator with XRE-family HTH domain